MSSSENEVQERASVASDIGVLSRSARLELGEYEYDSGEASTYVLIISHHNIIS
jgi:hypothetical protein